MADATNTAPLAGIKVIDWTQVQSGPWDPGLTCVY